MITIEIPFRQLIVYERFIPQDLHPHVSDTPNVQTPTRMRASDSPQKTQTIYAHSCSNYHCSCITSAQLHILLRARGWSSSDFICLRICYDSYFCYCFSFSLSLSLFVSTPRARMSIGRPTLRMGGVTDRNRWWWCCHRHRGAGKRVTNDWGIKHNIIYEASNIVYINRTTIGYVLSFVVRRFGTTMIRVRVLVRSMDDILLLTTEVLPKSGTNNNLIFEKKYYNIVIVHENEPMAK